MCATTSLLFSFILFDLEVAFSFFLRATILKDIVANESIKLFGFVEMMVFATILVVGDEIHAWAKGALEWE